MWWETNMPPRKHPPPNKKGIDIVRKNKNLRGSKVLKKVKKRWW